jgi:hypothetical protein
MEGMIGLRETGWEVVVCMLLALDRNQWQALLNTYFRVPYKAENFLIS